MKTTKMKKIVVAILTILIAIALFNNIVYGIQYRTEIHDPTENVDDWSGIKQVISPGENTIKNKVNNILGVINIIGVVSAAIVLMVIGIKYMMGSVEEKAEYKKTMGYYILGAILLFGGSTIPNVLYKIGMSINRGV